MEYKFDSLYINDDLSIDFVFIHNGEYEYFPELPIYTDGDIDGFVVEGVGEKATYSFKYSIAGGTAKLSATKKMKGLLAMEENITYPRAFTQEDIEDVAYRFEDYEKIIKTMKLISN